MYSTYLQQCSKISGTISCRMRTRPTVCLSPFQPAGYIVRMIVQIEDGWSAYRLCVFALIGLNTMKQL